VKGRKEGGDRLQETPRARGVRVEIIGKRRNGTFISERLKRTSQEGYWVNPGALLGSLLHLQRTFERILGLSVARSASFHGGLCSSEFISWLGIFAP